MRVLLTQSDLRRERFMALLLSPTVAPYARDGRANRTLFTFVVGMPVSSAHLMGYGRMTMRQERDPKPGR